MNYKFVCFFSILIICFFLFFLKHQYFNNQILSHDVEFYIESGASVDDVLIDLNNLFDSLDIVSKKILPILLKKKRLAYWCKSGRYIFKKTYSINDIINQLRSQVQSPVSITFNSMDSIHSLFGIASRKLELDSIDLINYLDSTFLSVDSLYFLAIPNTYEFFWDISPKLFFDRIIIEYKSFWNQNRLSLANNLNLSKEDVFILASIVDKEASHVDEMSKIAGLYLNRLEKNWYLAADPTIIYIWKTEFNSSIRRVRNKHINQTKYSKFNTYHNKGLPPLPICIPSFQAIESVLKAEKHDYMYMCARPDNSEYHNFAKYHFEHQKNAAAFHRWLNQRKIY